MDLKTKPVKNTDYYSIEALEKNSAIILCWKAHDELDIANFKKGIIDFATICKNYRPLRALIDARQLDTKGNPFGWVTGLKAIADLEPYNPWWAREIAPIFNIAQIEGLGVATGDPAAPGQLPSVPEGVNFKIGYFPDMDKVMAWRIIN